MIAVRYGGEEFLAIKFSEAHGDRDFAGELQERIAKAGLPRADVKTGRVTVSIGVWKGSLQELDSFEEALKYADRALYDAKKAGRDCICYYRRSSMQVNS